VSDENAADEIRDEISAEISGAAAKVPQTHADSVRKLADAMLRTAILPSVGVVAAGALIAWLAVGMPGLWGALLGGVIAIASSFVTLFLMKQSAELPPQVVMAVALGGYLVKIVALLIVAITLKDAAWLHPTSLALTLIAAVVAWTGAEIVAFRKTKIPTLIV